MNAKENPGVLTAGAVASVPDAAPPVIRSLADTGLDEELVEELLLKILYLRKQVIGAELSSRLGLPFSVFEPLLETLRRQQLVHGLRSTGMGSVSVLYALTEAGSRMAKDHLEHNRYAGKAPVPLDDYVERARLQRQHRGWLDQQGIEKGLAHMVIGSKLIMRLGPALNAGSSFLMYGHPGNGKTFLAESLANLVRDEIFIPHALESNGHIIQFYDPAHHKEVEEEQAAGLTEAPTYDKRWMRIRRPFIISGGELTLDRLDLSYDERTRYYTAPLQLMANNGFYLIDDLGRQQVSAREVLNRWIVPMEQGVDYLTFQNGSKISIPFDAFLIFSTNLNPDDISDEAFLRRIKYKLLVRDPNEDEFTEIFRRACGDFGFDFDPVLIGRFVDVHYRKNGRQMRRCHPRDVLEHAANLIHFHKQPRLLTDDILAEAFESCFLEAED